MPFEARTHELIPASCRCALGAWGAWSRHDDVELRYVEKVSEPGAVVQRLEDAVGRQTRQSVSADQPLTARALQQPLLVRKNEEVDVWVRCGGIQARRRAVALSDGTRGDLITVETDDGSKTQFNARVVDIRQVEVLPNYDARRSVDSASRRPVMKALHRTGPLALRALVLLLASAAHAQDSSLYAREAARPIQPPGSAGRRSTRN